MTAEPDPAARHTVLWQALQPLRSVACWLTTGAHPDDEWNGFLAWLALGQGVRTVYACALRGEGGQNALGPERNADLGAIRSREMELAACEIGLAVRWLNQGEDDRLFDFGFSRSAEDTLYRWGEAFLLERLVRVIRREQPDAVSPTFLDVPGQHGHHRAITRTTLRAIERAADAAFILPGENLSPWQVAKTYLPAFSGASASYDDSEPPPPATVAVDLGERCDALGATWAQIGENARRFHASQAMGRTLPDGPRPLRLHQLSGTPDLSSPLDSLTQGVGDLADRAPAPARAPMREAGDAIAAALAAAPDCAAALHHGLGAVGRARAALGGAVPDIDRRLALKQRQLARAAALALGLSARLEILPDPARAGGRVQVLLSVAAREMPTSIRHTLRLPAGWHAQPGQGADWTITIPPDAAPFGTTRPEFDPLGGDDLVGVSLRWTHAGTTARMEVDPPERLVLAPACDVSVAPDRIAQRSGSGDAVDIVLRGAKPPEDWPVLRETPMPDGALRLQLRAGNGRTELGPAGASVAVFAYPHIGRAARIVPARVAIHGMAVNIDPDAHVGVVATGMDRTLHWLRQIGISAEAVTDAQLEQGDFGRFSTILVGIFGFGQRPALAASGEKLRAWMQNGGSLVTLYHRPGDGWNPEATPPYRLSIGSPSLRWRVTDPTAPVTVLSPGHILLNWPNRIEAADWDGWVRERGLYFASEWAAEYQPLLAMSDPGEAPLSGALVSASVGRGRHVHVALALHHQHEAPVAGAFRLLANLIARN
jgi:LmbE family N-acetylglucosaminyl deacetylase